MTPRIAILACALLLAGCDTLSGAYLFCRYVEHCR